MFTRFGMELVATTGPKLKYVCFQILSGHEGPVTAVAFTPSLGSTLLASCSWDKSLRLWEAIETSTSKEIINLNAEGKLLKFIVCSDQFYVTRLLWSLIFSHVFGISSKWKAGCCGNIGLACVFLRNH